MDNNNVILHFSLIDGIGYAAVDRIVKKKSWDMDLCDVYTLRAWEIVHLFGVSQARAELIVAGLGRRDMLEREHELISRHNVSWMTVYDERYPWQLKNIHSPPIVVYTQGAQLAGQKMLAVIGSRRANFYGMSVIAGWVPELVRCGWTIVSGGAVGADTAAHRVTIDSGGQTVAVLGSGLLEPYPVRNKKLFGDIISSGGTLVSIFPLTAQPLASNFPARNRVIAGLSRGCLVVQAGENSGTRITARYALEEGRELFAVPGPVDDELCAGCHALIQDGAKLVTNVDDILVEFNEEACRETCTSSALTSNTGCLKATPCPDASGSRCSYKAEGPGAIIMRSCRQACSVDDLAHKTGLSLSDLYVYLFDLELAGMIRQESNGLWHCS